MKKLMKFIFSKLIQTKNNSNDEKKPWNYYNQLMSM
jgi:hypothetical protein